MEDTESSPPGWRERKRRDTHQRVWQSAIALFGERGYEATTLDAIAEASQISKRTFFHYFKSKEDVLAAWQAGVPDLFRAAIGMETDGTTPFEVMRNILAQAPAQFDADQAIVIHRIISSNEQLSASSLVKFLRLEQAVFEGLCERWPEPDRRGGLRVVAMTTSGALRLAIDRFAEEEGSTPLEQLLQEIFAHLAAELPHDR